MRSRVNRVTLDDRSDNVAATEGPLAQPPRRKIKLVIAYDGTDYHGWQIQPGFRTLQETLCQAATTVLRRSTHVQGASRTDTGVHAQGQVGLMATTHPIPVEHLALAFNAHLPRDIAVLEAREVDPDFDVMRDVTRKAYRYTICSARLRPVQQIRFCYHYLGGLSVEAMQAAARYAVGTQDFRSFAVKLEPGQKTVRTVFRCEVARVDRGDQWDWITIDVEGDGFLPHMVRLIAGTLVDIGRGHWRPEEMADILAARDRQAAGHLAPASGLCLEWIRFRQDASASRF